MANDSDNIPPWKPRKGWLGSVRGSANEAKTRAAADKAERKAAGEHPRSVILNQKDVLTGKWTPGKVLFTTLGGELRPITAEDLATFRLNIRTAQKHLTHGGITAKQVIDFSLGVDRVRTNEEIKLAVPVMAANSAPIRPPFGRERRLGNSTDNPPLFRSERSEWSEYPCVRFVRF